MLPTRLIFLVSQACSCRSATGVRSEVGFQYPERALRRSCGSRSCTDQRSWQPLQLPCWC